MIDAIASVSGALPAPVSIGEIRVVGASLGDELIKKGGRYATLHRLQAGLHEIA